MWVAEAVSLSEAGERDADPTDGQLDLLYARFARMPAGSPPAGAGSRLVGHLFGSGRQQWDHWAERVDADRFPLL